MFAYTSGIDEHLSGIGAKSRVMCEPQQQGSQLLRDTESMLTHGS